jgi:hypothetical protein
MTPVAMLTHRTRPRLQTHAWCLAGFWPTYKSMDLALPAEMVAGITAFKDFYEQESKHRKLTWVYTQVCGFNNPNPKPLTLNLFFGGGEGSLCLCALGEEAVLLAV